MKNIEEVLAGAKPTIVVLYRPGEEACEEVKPVVEQLRSRLGGVANVVTVDGTRHQELMREYKVASYPCWLLFKDGQVAWRDYGRKPVGELERMVRDFV